MTFQNQKKDFLSKKDKSSKGSIDTKIKSLVKKINKLENFYTTSSCAGRIVLYSPHKTGKKNQFKWHLVEHSTLSLQKLKKTLEKTKNKEIWFMIEPVILHVAAKNLEIAKKLLNTARDVGFRRSGIITEKKDKVVVMELVSTESLNTIVRKNNYQIDETYLKLILKQANNKLKKTWDKIKKLEREIK